MSRVPVSLSPQSDALSAAGRTAHDIGLAALLGGNLFGRLAMHPALERISDKSERGVLRTRTISSIRLLSSDCRNARNFQNRRGGSTVWSLEVGSKI